MRGATSSADYNLAIIGVDVVIGDARAHVEVICTGFGNISVVLW